MTASCFSHLVFLWSIESSNCYPASKFLRSSPSSWRMNSCKFYVFTCARFSSTYAHLLPLPSRSFHISLVGGERDPRFSIRPPLSATTAVGGSERDPTSLLAPVKTPGSPSIPPQPALRPPDQPLHTLPLFTSATTRRQGYWVLSCHLESHLS